jgi:hypothetical protein
MAEGNLNVIRRWLGVVLGLVSLAVLVYGQTQSPPVENWFLDILGLLAIASPSVVGAYLVWRLPRNPVGWILSGFGLTFTLGVIGEDLALTGGPLAGWGAWFGAWEWAVSLTLLLIFLPLLFPNGRLPSPRYRWVPPTALTGLALVIFGNALKPAAVVGSGASETMVALPISAPQLTSLFDPAGAVGIGLMLVCVAAALFGAVGRFRRSDGIERQQIKVFAGALAVAVVSVLLNLVLYESGLELLANIVFTLVVLTLVSSIAVAVLRYRLYDFGRVIRRTAVYGLVSVVLSGIYVGSVLGLQAVLGSEDALAVAGSTLAAAAMFQPVRRRIQGFVDRRFDRERYDARRVVDGFGTRLREEIDLDGLTTDLTAAVGQTLRPASFAVWLREEAR